MLTPEQIKWVMDRQNELIKFYEANIPLSEEKCDEINHWINETSKKGKSKEAEVRSALLDVVEVYAFADPQYIALMKKYGMYEETFKRMMMRWSLKQKEWFEGVGKNG